MIRHVDSNEKLGCFNGVRLTFLKKNWIKWPKVVYPQSSGSGSASIAGTTMSTSLKKLVSWQDGCFVDDDAFENYMTVAAYYSFVYTIESTNQQSCSLLLAIHMKCFIC